MNPVDENENCYAAIYTRNIDNSPDHLEQLLQKLDDLNDMGFEQVSPSAYFDKCLGNYSQHQSRHEAVISPLVTNSSENDETVVFVYDLADVTMSSVDNFEELKELIPEINWHLLDLFIDKLVLNIKCCEIYDIENFDNQVLAAKFETLKQWYNNISNGFDRKKSIISEELFELLEITESTKNEIRQLVVEHQKVFNQRWKTVEKCLKWVQKMSKKTTNKKKYVNVLLCDEGLDQAVIQMLLAGLSSFILIDHIFSKSFGNFENPVFERIRSRFGENCVMVHVTSNWENDQHYGEVPKLQRPVWWISSNESFKQLY